MKSKQVPIDKAQKKMPGELKEKLLDGDENDKEFSEQIELKLMDSVSGSQ